MNERELSLYNIQRFWGRVNIGKIYECWLFSTFDKSGYGFFRYYDKVYPAHRFSWLLSKGRIPNGQLALHQCLNKNCVNPLHLYLGNHQGNMGDVTISKALLSKIIDVDDIAFVKDLLKNNEYSVEELAKMCGIDKRLVFAITQKERWQFFCYPELKIMLEPRMLPDGAVVY